jgi:hypothetical protein
VPNTNIDIPPPKSIPSVVLLKYNNQNTNYVYGGYDGRFGNDTEGDLIYNISTNLKKMNLLKYLESPTVSSIDKTFAIDRYQKDKIGTILGANLKSGGLFKDWDFE